MTAASATAGWRRQDLLDFARKDVFAGGDDHLLLAAGDAQIPVLVERPMSPVQRNPFPAMAARVSSGRLRYPSITLCRAHEYLAVDVDAGVLASVVGDADLDVGKGSADGAAAASARGYWPQMTGEVSVSP